MCFGSGDNEIKTEQLPLMSPQQEEIFNKTLQGMFQMMQGFPLGQAYGGPVESSWSPQPFGSGRNVEKSGTTSMSPGHHRIKPPPGSDPTQSVGPGRIGGETPRGPGGRGMEGGGAYESILGSMGANEGLVPQPNAMTELLTSPFVAPFRQGMTGNYPKFRPPGM